MIDQGRSDLLGVIVVGPRPRCCAGGRAAPRRGGSRRGHRLTRFSALSRPISSSWFRPSAGSNGSWYLGLGRPRSGAGQWVGRAAPLTPRLRRRAAGQRFGGLHPWGFEPLTFGYRFSIRRPFFETDVDAPVVVDRLDDRAELRAGALAPAGVDDGRAPLEIRGCGPHGGVLSVRRSVGAPASAGSIGGLMKKAVFEITVLFMLAVLLLVVALDILRGPADAAEVHRGFRRAVGVDFDRLKDDHRGLRAGCRRAWPRIFRRPAAA